MNSQTTLEVWEEIEAAMNIERRNYNELRGQYAKFATDSGQAFAADLERNITKLDQLVQQASDLAMPHIFSAIDHAIKTLAEYKIRDIDRDHFSTTFYKKYDLWTEALSKLSAKHIEIVRSAEERNTDRAARRQDSGPIIGGGFGVEGAAKGIAVATAANLAISATTAVLGLAAKGIGAASDSLKKNSIFRDPATKAQLVAGLESSILNVHLAFLDALESRTPAPQFQRVSASDQEKAQRILSNLQQGLLNADDRNGVLKEILTLDPYCLEAYKFALECFGDESGSLDRLATFFHLNLLEVKRASIQPLIRTGSEADVIASIEAVRHAGKRLGIPVDSEFVAPLERQLQQMDIDARTVRGQLYSTREEARAVEVRLREERERKTKAIVATTKKGVVKILKVLKILLYCFLGFAILIVVVAFVKASGIIPGFTL